MGLPIYQVARNRDVPENALYLDFNGEQTAIEVTGPEKIIGFINEYMNVMLKEKTFIEVPVKNAPLLFQAVYYSQFDHKTFVPADLLRKVTQPLVANGTLPSQSEFYACISVGFKTMDSSIMGDMAKFIDTTKKQQSVDGAVTLALYFYSHNALDTSKAWLDRAKHYHIGYEIKNLESEWEKFRALFLDYNYSAGGHTVRVAKTTQELQYQWSRTLSASL